MPFPWDDFALSCGAICLMGTSIHPLLKPFILFRVENWCSLYHIGLEVDYTEDRSPVYHRKKKTIRGNTGKYTSRENMSVISANRGKYKAKECIVIKLPTLTSCSSFLYLHTCTHIHAHKSLFRASTTAWSCDAESDQPISKSLWCRERRENEKEKERATKRRKWDQWSQLKLGRGGVKPAEKKRQRERITFGLADLGRDERTI